MARKRFALLYTLRILLGLVFIASAVAKMLSIDAFEVYVYSYGWFSLPASSLLARLCVAAELMLGVGLASNLYGRFVNLMALSLLSSFSLFLLYAIIVGRSDNCQCFGDLIDFSPTQSLAKNVVLVAWLLAVRKVPSFRLRFDGRWLLPLGAAISTLPFVLCPPDAWTFARRDVKLGFNQPLLEDCMVNDSTFVAHHIGRGNQLVVMVTPSCKWCQKCVAKLQSIQRNHGLPDSSFVYVAPRLKEPVPTAYIPVTVDGTMFMHLSYGQFPVIVAVIDGKALRSFHCRSLTEEDVVAFLLPE